MRSNYRLIGASWMRGTLPARFRRQRILIIGCGDVGSRMLQLLHALPQRNVMVLKRNLENDATLRQQGVRVLRGDLDDIDSLYRLAGLAHRIVHLAPPAVFTSTAVRDNRTRNLVQALRARTVPQHVVYVSTTGVYGDCAGALVGETNTPKPRTARARRRLDAEYRLRQWTKAGVGGDMPRLSILRSSGIYASARWVAGMKQRLNNNRAVLCDSEDIYTNHIHIDDLARACWLALWRGAAQRVYNVNDNSQLKMAKFYDLVAQSYQLPTPVRISYKQAKEQLSAATLSFMQESRRLTNKRLQRELGLRLKYPTFAAGLTRKIR